ncbi:histidine kinase [Dactylosporangium sp. CA-233914]|uniref:sensor histidine kinase n=1 Tax=Dactylosporangium sp. CA-233914 TaxID=3239934 RepID=UPI003D8A4521
MGWEGHSPRSSVLVASLAAGGAALGVAGLVLKAEDGSHPVPDLVFGGVTGLLFLAAGVVAHVRRPANRAGLLMVLFGTGWFAEDLQFSWIPWVFTVGGLFSHVSTALGAHLVLAYPTGRLTSPAQRVLAALAYLVAVVWPAIGVLFYNPVSRGQVKPANLLMIRDDPRFVQFVVDSMQLGGGIVACGVVAVLLHRFFVAGRPMRLILAPVFVTGIGGATATAVGGVAGYDSPAAQVVLLAYKVWCCLLPLGFLAGVLRVRIGPTRVDTLLVELGTPAGGTVPALRALLRRSLGDATAEVGLWDGAGRCYVDDEGHPVVLPDNDASRAVTRIDFDGRPLAVLVHDPALLEDPVRLDAVTGGAAVALERQRLAGEMLAEVERSRERIVEATDAERQRFGRDLHDGAQQNLAVAAAYLRRAVTRLDNTGDETALEALRRSDQALQDVTRELREIAHGLRPAALTDLGVDPAVRALADAMPIPVTITATVVPRLEPTVEYTVYLLVKEAFANTLKHGRATRASVRLEHTGTLLRVYVTDDGQGAATPERGRGLLGLQDRVHAVGGRFSVTSAPGEGTTLAATLPARPVPDAEGAFDAGE